MPTTCACGCGQQIPIQKLHPERKPKFIQGHWSRTRAYRRMKDASRATPPDDWTPPSGVCECGCRGQTAIAPVTSRRRDQYRGYPMRYLRGHSPRVIGDQTSNWKGGRTIDGAGYIMIRVDGRYRPEHRLVWEAANGPVPAGRHIHHINGVRTDNRLENLECLTRSEHKRLHQHSLSAYNSRIPDDELITAYRMLWRRLRRPPLRDECTRANGTPEWSTYNRRFGSIHRVRQLSDPDSHA